MTLRRHTALAVLAGSLSVFALSPAFAAGTTIDVSLWDKGSGSMDTMDTARPMGMAMMGDMHMVTMGIKTDKTEVPAGEVTFKVRNDSRDLVHEMIVARVADTTKPLPYIKDENRVDEDKAGDIGEVSELDPGQTGALTATLDPGSYILYCNVPGHYMMGMWTLVTVKG